MKRIETSIDLSFKKWTKVVSRINRHIGNNTIAAVRIIILLALVLAMKYEANGQCEAITREGIFNSSLYTSSSNYRETVDDLIFSSDFRTHDEAISSGLSVGFPVFDVPLEIGGTFTTEQKETLEEKVFANTYRYG